MTTVVDLWELAELAVRAAEAQKDALERLTRAAYEAGVSPEQVAACYRTAALRLGVALVCHG